MSESNETMYNFFVDARVSGLWGRAPEDEVRTTDETELASELTDVLRREFEANDPNVDLEYDVTVDIESVNGGENNE